MQVKNLNNVLKKDLKLFQTLLTIQKIYKVVNDRESKLKILNYIENILNELDMDIEEIDQFIKLCYEDIYQKRINIYRQLDKEEDNE